MSYKTNSDYPPNLDTSPTLITPGHKRKSQVPHHINARIQRKSFSKDRSFSMGENLKAEQDLMENSEETSWSLSTGYQNQNKEKLYFKKGTLTPGISRRSYNDSSYSYHTEKLRPKFRETRLIPHKSETELESCSGNSSEASYDSSYISPYSFLSPLPKYPSYDYEGSSSRHFRKSSAGSNHLSPESVYSRNDSYHIQSQLAKMMFRLTVDDHQALITSMASAKKDYIHNSTEHRSENSPSPSNTNSGANSNSNSAHLNLASPHVRSSRGSSSSKYTSPGGGAPVPPPPPSPTWNDVGHMNPPDTSVRSSPTTPKVPNHNHLDPEASLEENVLENCDLYLYYQLGVGNFGVVMQGVLRNLDSGKERSVAVKILRCTEGETAESSRQQMLREAKVMSELNHPNVIKLIGIFNGPELMLVSELAPVGQLNKYLKRNHGVPVEMLMNYALQVANGMAYLERKSFVHRDLAARNVLLATDRHARISDFGMSRMLSFNKDYYRANDGGHWPVRWYAPQCIYFFTFTSKSDVWSYGVTLWEIFSYGQRPYGSMCSSEIMQMLDKGARLKCPTGCPPEMYTLMLRCWEYEEADRPTFEEIFQVVEIYFRAQASRSRDVYTG